MTFELSAAQQAARDRAQAFARGQLAPAAAAIDESGRIDASLLQQMQPLIGAAAGDSVLLVTVVEELAVASAGAAAAAASVPGTKTNASTAPGLRGFHATGTGDTRSRLVMAAVALGIGRAAVAAAIDTLRASARQSQDQEKPHWAVADAATEVAAARALTLHAAQTMADEQAAAGFVAMAKLAAARAAQLAVDVALRVTGPQGFVRGALLERLARDAQAVALVLGTEEDLRAVASNALFPG
jgi:alkylation response protein AidB-like acyl-CoA dehydrogenase